MKITKQKNNLKSFNVFCKKNEISRAIANDISDKLIEKGLSLSDTPDIVICVGGDGTFLRAIENYENQLDTILFCGVHSGTLGFLTDFKKDQVPELIESITTKDYYVEESQMLETTVYYDKGVVRYLSLNEGRIENNLSTQVMDVYIDDNHFETFRGNGLNFSTSTGSTGYNKSLGGAIIHPRVDCFQMCEIASINNREYRPLGSSFILSSKHVVTLVMEDIKGLVFGYDTRTVDLKTTFKQIDKIQFAIAKETAHFIRFVHKPFSQRVKHNFIK